MLGETLKLASSPPDDLFDVPWCNVLRISRVKFLDQLRVALSQTTSSSKRVLFVNVLRVDVK
jgi:hypothetical protein